MVLHPIFISNILAIPPSFVSSKHLIKFSLFIQGTNKNVDVMVKKEKSSKKEAD